MRIVLVFLVLIGVSIAGVGVLAANAMRVPVASPSAAPTTQPASSGAGQSGAAQSTAAPAARPTTAPAAQPAPASGDVFTFTIQQGETTGDIAAHLASLGMVRNGTLFRYYVQFKGAEGKLQAGDYQLRRGMSMDELIEALQQAKAKEVAITFVEGWRLEQFAEALDKANAGIDSKVFLDHVKRGQFTYDFLADKPGSASLEGYLFPDTYRVVPGQTTADDLIHQMLKRFGDTVTPQLRDSARKNGLTTYQMVTLASIVEREAQIKEERPRIAAVYLNRIRDKDCLCADPTVQFAIAKPGDWWPQLQDQARNIRPDDPYNTYTHMGLPPGPIASAGAASLKAAADPEKTDYRYFVRDDVKNDGSHVFARTLDEHNRNIQRYQRLP